MEVNATLSPFYKKKDVNSELISECLFGENIEILKEDTEWIFGRLLTDNYEGWTLKKNLVKTQKKNYRVSAPRSIIQILPNIKEKTLCLLSLGSLLNVIEKNNEWATITFYLNEKKILGYVPTKHIVKLNKINCDWVSIAERLIETPYKWGGRSSFALDCSALVQLSLQTAGKKMPRDTNLQYKVNYKQVFDLKNLKRGMLIFWKGHVAITINETQILHANAFSMNTNIEAFNAVHKRIKKIDSEIIKILDLNN